MPAPAAGFEGALRAFARWIEENRVPIYSEAEEKVFLRISICAKAGDR